MRTSAPPTQHPAALRFPSATHNTPENCASLKGAEIAMEGADEFAPAPGPSPPRVPSATHIALQTPARKLCLI